MKLDLVDEGRNVVTDPYLIRLPGWTWDRYLAEAPESRFCEYEDGDFVMHSPVDAVHQGMVRFLTCLLQLYCKRLRAGDVFNGPAVIRVAPEIGREPDVFVLDPQESSRASGAPLEVCPLLIVEVASTSTRRLDLETKPDEYRALGVPEYWVVDRATQTVYHHRLEAGTYRVQQRRKGRLASTVLNGFFVEVEWLWQEPLPSEIECLQKLGLFGDN
ncbi:MAG: Uma2 family endonuclease [Planctomycetota bacterium]